MAQEKVSDKDYEDHLKGTKSIGIQPCTDEGTARFGAIDVDKYPIDREFYLKTIQEKIYQSYQYYLKVAVFICMSLQQSL